jgi:hypothetical protein
MKMLHSCSVYFKKDVSVWFIYFALLAAAELDPSNENVRQNIEVMLYVLTLFHLKDVYGS